MIIAYCGGITLSLYPIVEPMDILREALKDQSQYLVEDCNDFIKVRFSKQFIDDFIIKVWEPRTHTPEIESFKKILENICFESKLFEDGYLEALIKTESDEVTKIFTNEILGNNEIKEGFSDEIESHFRDLYEVVYNKVHKHTYLRLYERLSHVILNEGNLDLIAAKEDVIDYFRDTMFTRLVRPLMRNIDDYEDEIFKIEFSDFLFKKVCGIVIYQYMSERTRYLRRSIWALKYVGMCLPNRNTQANEFQADLDAFAYLLDSRKEITESIKNSIAYYITLISTILTFLGVVLAIVLIIYNTKMAIGVIVTLMIISLILILHVMYGSIKIECERVKTGLLQ